MAWLMKTGYWASEKRGIGKSVSRNHEEEMRKVFHEIYIYILRLSFLLVRRVLWEHLLLCLSLSTFSVRLPILCHRIGRNYGEHIIHTRRSLLFTFSRWQEDRWERMKGLFFWRINSLGEGKHRMKEKETSCCLQLTSSINPYFSLYNIYSIL